jgi:hypothetical protein
MAIPLPPAQVRSSQTPVQNWLNWTSKSKLLYDWRFTANQFVLASGPLRPTTRDFFQLKSCDNSPYVTSSLTRRWVYLFMNTLMSKSKSHCDWRSVSQPVSLGVEPPSGAHDQIFITVWQLQSCYCGAPSLMRGRVCLLSESLSAV